MKDRIITAFLLIVVLGVCIRFGFLKIPCYFIIFLIGWEIIKNQNEKSIWTAFAIFQMHGLIWIKYMSRIEILFLAIVIVLNDSAAYFGGKYFKFSWTQKLCPKISPQKTYAGLAYGLTFATVGAIIFEIYVPIFGGILKATIAGFFLAIFGVAGDLVESKFKRVNEIKDSGQGMITGEKIFNGHGGAYDRFDAASMALWGWIILKLALKFFV